MMLKTDGWIVMTLRIENSTAFMLMINKFWKRDEWIFMIFIICKPYNLFQNILRTWTPDGLILQALKIWKPDGWIFRISKFWKPDGWITDFKELKTRRLDFIDFEALETQF